MLDKWHNWDWVRNGHNQLVVTLGESWTWGDSLGKTQYRVYDDREFRLSNVYGAKLADQLNADFINIAEPGQSNLWIVDHLDWAKNNVGELGYNKIYYVATLTEVGREFNGDRDSDRVYTEMLKNIQTFDEFLSMLSDLVADRLCKHPDVIVGTNFVSSNYPNSINVLPQSWMDLICQHNHQPVPLSCAVVQSWVFEKFAAVFEFNPNLNRKKWLSDVLFHMERAEQRTNLLLNSPLNYKKASKHPTPDGHNVWANYLFQHILNQSL